MGHTEPAGAAVRGAPGARRRQFRGRRTSIGDNVYWTEDGGDSWQRTGDGLSGLRIFDIAVDPEDGKTVYAATSAGVAVFERP